MTYERPISVRLADQAWRASSMCDRDERKAMDCMRTLRDCVANMGQIGQEHAENRLRLALDIIEGAKR